jgi:putative ABC transport system permease protein
VNGISLRIAWRNLWRHTQRTILMIAIVAFGSWVILVMWGITDGFIRSMTDTHVVYNQGNLQFRALGYADDPVPSNGLTPEQVDGAKLVLRDANVRAFTDRLEVSGMIRSSYGSDGVVIRGIDPLSEQRVTKLHEAVLEGRFLADSGEIILSAKLAESLDIRLNERVVLLAQGSSGTHSQAFRAVGFFALNLGELENMVAISLEDAHALSEWAGLTAIAIALPSGASVSKSAGTLESQLASADVDGIEVADYFALNPLARTMLQGASIKMIPFVIMISLMAGFGVANTAFYSVLERTREFGVMTAVGMSRKLLAQVVLMESVFVSAIGFVFGGGVGYGCLMYLSRYGLNFGDMMAEFGGELGIPTIMYASTSGWYWLGALSVVVFTALVAAWYPARRANGLDPVTAIREG